MKKAEQGPLFYPSDHPGLPRCIRHPTVWAEYRGHHEEAGEIDLCWWCQQKPPKGVRGLRKLKKIKED